MMPLSSHVGIKARLLGLMALIILPIALASVLVASRNFHSALERIEAERANTATDFSVRTRIWYRGAMRSLLATYAAIETEARDPATCGRIAAASLRLNIGYSALHIRLPDGTMCTSSLSPILSPEVLNTISIEQSLKPAVKSWVGPMLAPTRYDVFRAQGNNFLVIQLEPGSAGGLAGVATLVVEPSLLDAVFDIGAIGTTTVALVRRGVGAVVTRGPLDKAAGWLPVTIPEAVGYTRFSALSISGDDSLYSVTPIAGTDLVVLARFSSDEEEVQKRQYLFMALMPLAILGFLFLAYYRAIQSDVIRWISGIKLAARARIEDAHSNMLAPVSDSMPRELRSVSTAFNAMVVEGQAREQQLVRSLDENRHLMRELHHRVKNSLQVIQSYLALSRRQKAATEQAPLAEIEARVLVLSIAYRLALDEGGMRAVPLQPFGLEVVNNLAATLRRQDQKVTILAKTDAALNVDQVIPFGLAIVECVTTALASPTCERVNIDLTRNQDNALDLTISACPEGSVAALNDKIMRGLCLQLRAIALPAAGTTLLHWRLET